jgi:probable phosphoglycerate mutase
MAVERIHLIRHGETDWNATGRWQGFAQIPLNAQGMAQAQALAVYLQHRPIKAIYSSDLLRAWQTASALGDVLGITPQSHVDWREHHLGIFQGLTREEIQSTYPQEYAGLNSDYLDFVIPQGESRLALQNRVHRIWEATLEWAEGPEVAIVSHGGAIKMLLLKLFADDKPELRQVYLPNTCISTIERNGHGWQLVEVGITPHL